MRVRGPTKTTNQYKLSSTQQHQEVYPLSVEAKLDEENKKDYFALMRFDRRKNKSVTE